MACASSSAMRDLDIDLIDHYQPLRSAYAVLAKAMDEKSLRQVRAAIIRKEGQHPRRRGPATCRARLAVQDEQGAPAGHQFSRRAWEKRTHGEGVAALALLPRADEPGWRLTND